MTEQKSSAVARIDAPEQKMLAALEKLKPQLRNALPRSMNADRFARVVVTEIRRNPKLLECEPISFFAAVFTAAQIGLEVGSHLGEAFLIPFRNNKRGVTECTLIVGYKGLVKLMWESEQIASLSDVYVRAKDKIEYRQGDNEAIIHEPYVPPIELLAKLAEGAALTKDEKAALDPGPVIAYYSIIEMKNGGKRRAVMWVNEAVDHRDHFARNATRDDSVWKTNFDAMAMKTVLRKAAKLAPRAVERPSLQQAIALDELAEAGVGQDLQLPAEVTPTGEAAGLSLTSFTKGAEVIESKDDAK
jgi:recombination protein RecT